MAVELDKDGSGILQALKREPSIKHMIHRQLAGWESPRPHGTIHASELLKEREFCPREWAFLDLGVVRKPDEFVGTAMRITFDHGRDMEYRLRNDWLRPYMVGHWECEVCGHQYEKFGKAPKNYCTACGWFKWQYKEVRVLDPDSGVSGGIDGFVDVGEKKLRLLEIKSMDKDQHKTLLAPLAEHKMRTALYLYLVAKSVQSIAQRVNQSKATILYVSKSYGFKDESLAEVGIKDAPFSPFKEFIIERDDTLIKTPLARATALTHWRKLRESGTAVGLPCGICHNGLIKRAQQCTACSVCFSGSYPGTITWMENGEPRHPNKPITVGAPE